MGGDGKCPACETFILDRRDIVCPKCGIELPGYPNFCWNTEVNREMLLGSSEKTALGRVAEKIAEMPPTDVKLEIMYRIDVRQNAIRKQAYDYFTNIKKNARQTGDIFAQIPSEMRGNITCITDPARPVIGYMDVSSAVQKRLWISRRDDAYERDVQYCQPFYWYDLFTEFGANWQSEYIYVPMYGFVQIKCVDCTYGGATKYRPGDWPDSSSEND